MRLPSLPWSCTLACVIAQILAVVPAARAGDGEIVAHETPGGTFDYAEINASIYVDLPRTDEEYDKFEEQLRGANQLICDYTDGMFRLSELRYVHHPAEKRSADMLWFRREARASADGGSFGKGTGPNPTAARGNLRIYGTEPAETIAHELGHLIFNAWDHYPDRRGTDGPILASTSIDSPDSFIDPLTGAEFFRSVFHMTEASAPIQLRETITPGPVPMSTMGTSLYRNGPAGEPWWLVNNSMMQQSSGALCRDVNGLSASQINPLIFVDGHCGSNADDNSDGIDDDCAAFTWKECNAGRVGDRCTVDVQCDTAPGAADGQCLTDAGFPHCSVADINTSSELTAALNHDLNRFNRTTDVPVAIGNGNAHVREARHLVIQGYLHPSSTGQPSFGAGGDRPCYDRDPPFDSTPDGVCMAECNPGIVVGDPAWANQCDVSGRTPFSGCPFSALASSPNNAACTVGDNPLCDGIRAPLVDTASCDQCLIGNSESCLPMFGSFAMTTGTSPFCGDGNVDSDPNPLPPNPTMWRLIEQCDNGSPATGNAPDPNVPLTDPSSGDPLRCADVGNLLPTGTPDPELVGGLVHCQSNCFLDLSRCSHPLLSPEFDPGPDGIVQLTEARDQSTLTAFSEVYDGNGKVGEPADPSLSPLSGGQLDLKKMGPSNHGVFSFFKRLARFRVNDPTTGDAWSNPFDWADHRYHELWQLIVGMDKAEFSGPGFEADMQEVRRFELEFEVDYAANTSTLLAVNGHSCATPGTECLSDDENEWPQVFLGFATNPGGDPYEGDSTSCQIAAGGCAQPQPATGPFQREECRWNGSCMPEPSPAEVTLRLDLRNLFVRTIEGSTRLPLATVRGGTHIGRGGLISAYARHDLANVGGLAKEIPQLGSTRYRMGEWNPICDTNPASDCCYHCSSPPNPIPSQCKSGPGNRDWCQDQDRRAEFYELTGFNNDLDRYDTARSTRAMLERQYFGAFETPTYPEVPFPETVPEENALRTNVLTNPDSFIHSDWEVLERTMGRRWGITLDPMRVPQDGSNIDPSYAGAPGTCPDPTILPRAREAVDFNEDLQIVFVLDRSGSMGVDDTTVVFGKPPRSRLDFVKNAARDFLDDVLRQVFEDGGARGPKVGLVWYSDETEVRSPELTTTPCDQDSDCVTSQSCVPRGGSQKSCSTNSNCSGGDTCINGVCARANQSVCAADLRFLSFATTPTTIDINTLKSQMVLSGEGVTEIPEPGGPDGGFTGSGAALEVAAHLFDPGRVVNGSTVPPTRILVILSDGLHNRPKGGDCLGPKFCTERDGSRCRVGKCGSSGTAPCPAEGDRANDPGCWPTSVADERFENAFNFARNEGILIYSIPLANSSDRAAQAVAVGRVAGEIFEANRNFGEDAPPVFAQARAATQGEQLARTHHQLPHLESGLIGQEFLYNYIVSQIKVEPGARSLSARISDYDALDGTGFENAAATNAVLLRSPSGTAHSYFSFQSAPGVSREGSDLSSTLRVLNPEPGIWRIEDQAPREQNGQYYIRFYTSAAVDNPSATCYAEASRTSTNGTGDITISAQAVHEGPIESGATYSGTLLRPDFTVLNLDFVLDEKGMGRAVIRPTDLVGNGSYSVNVTCDVTAGARVEAGENLPGEQGPPPPQLVSDAFQRQVTTGFTVNGPGLVPVPGIGGNNQSQAHLDQIATRITCPAGPTCTIPLSFAPVVPFLNDADGDGIPNSQEPVATVDTDGDGRPDIFDTDANGNERPDGDDPCLQDIDPPTVTAAAVSVQTCVPAPKSVVLNASASDACGSTPTLVGRLVTAAGKTVPGSVPVVSGSAILLPPGTSTVEWTATDAAGNVRVVVQSVQVQAVSSAAACCPAGSTVVNGSDWFDWLFYPWPGSYCVFGKGGSDNINVGPGTDFVSAGTGNDHIEADGNHDTVVGDSGHDVLELLDLCESAAAYGGDGDDWIELVGNGLIYGNGGRDSIHAWGGNQEIIPGPGKDFVDAGFGNDIVRIQHVCETTAFEVLDGGPGNDTLYTPVSLTQLNALGVIVIGFENVVVTTANQHLSECLP